MCQYLTFCLSSSFLFSGRHARSLCVRVRYRTASSDLVCDPFRYKMKTPCQSTGGFTEKTLLVKNLLVLSFHYPINILAGNILADQSHEAKVRKNDNYPKLKKIFLSLIRKQASDAAPENPEQPSVLWNQEYTHKSPAQPLFPDGRRQPYSAEAVMGNTSDCRIPDAEHA